MDRFPLGRAMAFAIALASGCGGDDPATADPTTVQVPDGAVVETQCTLPALDTTACGVHEGLPYYGYYDGCNWCNCVSGAPSCTQRACIGDGGLGTDPVGPGGCSAISYGVGSVSLPEGEGWVCDAEGRLYRSACAPAPADAGIADAGMDSGTGGSPVNGPDGSVIETQCNAATFTATACGVYEGQPYYGYYDGCNWCSCVDGTTYCTNRACLDADGGYGSIAFQPSDCTSLNFGVTNTTLPENESWVCDADGRLYRSACTPATLDGGI